MAGAAGFPFKCFLIGCKGLRRVGLLKVNTPCERICAGAGLHDEPDKENILPLYATF